MAEGRTAAGRQGRKAGRRAVGGMGKYACPCPISARRHGQACLPMPPGIGPRNRVPCRCPTSFDWDAPDMGSQHTRRRLAFRSVAKGSEGIPAPTTAVVRPVAARRNTELADCRGARQTALSVRAVPAAITRHTDRLTGVSALPRPLLPSGSENSRRGTYFALSSHERGWFPGQVPPAGGPQAAHCPGLFERPSDRSDDVRRHDPPRPKHDRPDRLGKVLGAGRPERTNGPMTFDRVPDSTGGEA